MTTPSPAEGAEPSLGHRIYRNTLYITLGSVALKGLGFLYGILVVRRLGDALFGEYRIVLAWVGLFTIFAELGITQYAYREIARAHDQAERYFWNVLTLRVGLAVVGIVGITAGAAVVGYPPEIVTGVLVYTCSFLLAALLSALETVLSAQEKIGITVVSSLLGQAASIALGAAVLLAGFGLVPFIAIGLLAMLVPIGVLLTAIRRERLLTFRPQIEPQIWTRIIRGGFPFAIISLALTIAFSIDTVMLSWFVPSNEVGWYGVSYSLVGSVVGLMSALSVALVPSLARIYATDPEAVERWYYRSVKFSALLAIPAALGATLVATPLFTLLYLPSTLPAAGAFQILAWDIPLLMFTSMCGNMSYVVGAERSSARIYTLNAVFNVILNLVAIPFFGMYGAAIVTVLTDLVGAAQFHMTLSRHLRLPNVWPALARIALASAVMGGVVFVSQGLGPIVQIALGIVSYGVATLAFGALDASDRRLVARALNPLLRRLGVQLPA